MYDKQRLIGMLAGAPAARRRVSDRDVALFLELVDNFPDSHIIRVYPDDAWVPWAYKFPAVVVALEMSDREGSRQIYPVVIDGKRPFGNGPKIEIDNKEIDNGMA